MKNPLLLAAVFLCLLGPATLLAKQSSRKSPPAQPSGPARDDAVRLQIFLDEQNFGPGKIDGRYGGFTKLAWLRWQAAQGVTPVSDTFDPKSSGLAGIDPLYVSYTITAADVKNVGPLPRKTAEQAKVKVLPYASLAELLGEKFHSSVDFLQQLNAPKRLDGLKVGDAVNVPNILPPFDLSRVRDRVEKERLAVQAAKAFRARQAKEKAHGDSEQPPAPAAAPDKASASTEEALANPAATPLPPPLDPPRTFIHISLKECLLEVHEGDKIVAEFPVTPGSKTIPTPVGHWQIDTKTLFPEFRWDKEMLMHGHRGQDAFLLPPGPRNPVGIAWMGLNRPGIGMHGTNSPETIGRSASHGCIRLSNWDAFKLYGLVAKGMKVVIE